MADLTVVGKAGETALDTVVGGASLALDAVTRPRRSAGRARRRGSDVNEVITEVAEDVVDEVSALPPEYPGWMLAVQNADRLGMAPRPVWATMSQS